MDLEYNRLIIKINKALEILALVSYTLYCSPDVLSPQSQRDKNLG